MYEEGLKLIDERFGNGKDNIISLATITRELNSYGKPRPVVRSVDAYYEDGTFYKDENCCILAIHLTRGTLNINHWQKLYHMDFVNKTVMDNGGIF